MIDPSLASDASSLGHGNPLPSMNRPHTIRLWTRGNAVANTHAERRLRQATVADGILMNNEMDDFSAKPGSPNGYIFHGEANARTGEAALSARLLRSC
jgi:gamma-glutamyltranspeptidase/glutathione hydrolase